MSKQKTYEELVRLSNERSRLKFALERTLDALMLSPEAKSRLMAVATDGTKVGDFGNMVSSSMASQRSQFFTSNPMAILANCTTFIHLNK